MHQRPDNSNNDANNSTNSSSGAQQPGLLPGQSQAADICSRLEAMDVVRNVELRKGRRRKIRTKAQQS